MLETCKNRNIIIVIVNYFSSREVIEYIEAIQDDDDISVVIVNNGDKEDDVALLKKMILNKGNIIYLESGDNLGYMGGAKYAYEKLKPFDEGGKVNWFILSNADIRINPRNLQDGLNCVDRKIGSPIMLVAPKIISSLTGKNQNPYLVNRPSRLKYFMLSYVFSIYPLAVLHRLMGALKNKITKNASRDKLSSQESIYSGHGSFMIFNRKYFERGGCLNNKSFLFCEENYVAERVRRLKGLVFYQPSIVVTHKEHITTGLIPSIVMTRYMARAHSLCAKEYMAN